MPALQSVHWHTGPHIGKCKAFQVRVYGSGFRVQGLQSAKGSAKP